jgi:hypothetical protein
MFGVSHGAIQFGAYEELKKHYHNYYNQPITTKYIFFKFLYIFLAGERVLPMPTPLRMSPILYFWEMSGFEPRELPYQAGALSI